MLSVTYDSLSVAADGTPVPSAASTLAAPEAWFLNFATGNPTGEPGPAVNEFTCFNYLAVFQCVSLIAGKIAELPLETYRDDGIVCVPAKDRSERPLLLEQFNRAMSAMTARETGLGHLLTWGNSFCQITRNKSGSKVVELVPTGPDVTKVRRAKDGSLVYDVFKRGTSEQLATVAADDMLHVPGLGFDGLLGYSPIRVAKTSIRSGMAQDRAAERFATRGVRPPGAIKLPEGKKFRDTQEAIEFRDQFRRIHSTEEGDLNVVILEDGAEWQTLGVDPKSAQLLDSRKYSRKEICGIYRVPPFLIGDIESSTSWGTGVAQQMQNFVDYCLLTWMRRVEVEYKRKLAPDDPDIHYRHKVAEMLRGDFAGRTDALSKLHTRGIITDNEWRKIEHFNPAENGDVRHVPLNEVLIDADGEIVSLTGGPAPDTATGHESDTAAAGNGDIQSTALNGAQITSLLLVTDKVAGGTYTAEAGEAILQASFPLMDRTLISTMIQELSEAAENEPAETPAQEATEPGEKAARLAAKLRTILVNSAGRCLRKEATEAVKAAARPDQFIGWIDSFYSKHADMVADHTGAAAEAWAAAFGGSSDYPARHVARSKSELLSVADGDPDGFPDRVSRLAGRWTAERLADISAEFQPQG